MTKEERIVSDHELDAWGDTVFAPVPCDHPEACSTDSTDDTRGTYPWWRPEMGCIKAPGEFDGS